MGLLHETTEYEALDLLASALTPQLRSALMEGLSDPIMRKIAFSLSQRMRCPVQLLSCVNGVVSHDTALSALPDVMLAGIADLAPLHGRIIIAIEGDLIGTVVDAMFGATSSDFIVRNDLSAMEIRIGKQMIELTLDGIADVLSSFSSLNWKIVQYETAVNMLAIADKQDWMISTTGIFETSLGIGSIRAILPYSALEPFETRVTAQTWLIGHALIDHRWTAMMARLTAGTPVDITFDVVRTLVPLGIVRRLKPGDVLPVTLLPHAVGYSGGLDLFDADYGQLDGAVCCRPVAGHRDVMRARSPRSHDQPEGQGLLHKLHGGLGKSAVDAASIFDRVKVDLIISLGGASKTVGSLTELKAGELIRLEQRIEESLPITIGGKYFGQGEIVSLGGASYGFKIADLARTDGQF